jgi:hypothetical protein
VALQIFEIVSDKFIVVEISSNRNYAAKCLVNSIVTNLQILSATEFLLLRFLESRGHGYFPVLFVTIFFT